MAEPQKLEGADRQEKEPVLVSVIKRQCMNNSKVSRMACQIQIPTKEEAEKSNPVGVRIKEDAINMVIVWRDKDLVLPAGHITQFDMDVIDAVYTLMYSGYETFTAKEVARVLSGNPKQVITPKKIEAIRNSIDRLNHIYIKIDCTEEADLREGTESKEGTYVLESSLLACDEVDTRYKVNGKETMAYHMREKPVLYRYAETNKQIINIPAELLDTHKLFSDTDEAILVKRICN